MISRSGKEIVINKITYFHPFVNNKYSGFKIGWDSNIGFGEITISKKYTNKEYYLEDFHFGDWKCETETMSNNEHKEFVNLVMNKFIEQLDIIE